METDVTNLDPKILKVMKALRSVESGDGKGGGSNYKAVGDSGSSTGAFQWNNGKTPVKPGQIPVNFQSDAKTYGFDPTDFSPANQNKVMYHKIKAQKDSGLDPEEIAALHNGASKDPSTGKYIYNNPEYGVKFRTALAGSKVNVPAQPPEDLQNILSGNYQAPEAPTGMTSDVTTNPGGVVKDFVNSATKAPMVLGGGVLNLATQAAGGTPQPTYSNPLGEQQNALGYRDGEKLSGYETAKQGAGALMEGLSYGIGGPEIKGALETGKAGVLPYLKESAKAGGKMLGLASAGSSLQEDGSIPTAIGHGAAGYAGGYLLGGLTGAVAAKYNKAAGYSPEIFNNLDDAVKAGDSAKVAEITASPEYKRFVAANKYDSKAVDNSVKKIRESIDEGIGNSYGVSKMTRTEKAELLTDDGIKAMLEHAQNTKNPIGDTKLALENKANDLMDSALNPVIDKVRNEKLPLVPLSRQELIDNFNTQLDKSYITDLDKQKIRDYVDTLINTQNKGGEFGIVDAGIIRRDANFDFTNPKNKGAVSRILGNTMRDALSNAEKTATDPATKAIIAHINAVNKEYSRLMQGVDVIDLMARFPGQKSSELLNKAAGFFGAGASGNNPLAYLGAHRLTNTAQNMVIRSKTGKLFGDLSSKSGPISSSELIGNAQRILNNVGKVSQAAEMKAAPLALPSATAAVQSANHVPISVSPTSVQDVSRGFTGSNPLQTNLRGMADTGILNKLAGLSAAGVAGATIYKKLADVYGKETYQRDPELKKELQAIPEAHKVDELVSQIANAETRGEKDPYTFFQWSIPDLGPASPLGKALGRYQVTEARLREKAKDFLGKKVSSQEFLSNPALQDAFIKAQVAWQKENGLSDEEVLATHRRGWGNMKPEQLKKAVANSKEYIASARTGK